MISLSLIMRLISAIMSELTHTARDCQRPEPSKVVVRESHSLCESASRFGSSSCSHSGRLLSGHRQLHGSRTLIHRQPNIVESCLLESSHTEELMAESARVAGAKSLLALSPYVHM